MSQNTASVFYKNTASVVALTNTGVYFQKYGKLSITDGVIDKVLQHITVINYHTQLLLRFAIQYIHGRWHT